MPEFVKRSTIHAPARAVFAWHLRPDALEKLIPPWESVEIEQRPASLGNGDRAVLRIRNGPISLRWVAEHHGFEDRGDRGGEFTDTQVSGPFKSWRHRHLVSDDGPERCVLEDRVVYELPGGAMGAWLGGAITRRKLERMFDFRHAVTRRECEAPGPTLIGARTNQGATLGELSMRGPLLVVFLRHAGCTFCREALADLALRRSEIERRAGLALVHMGEERDAAVTFAKYGLADVPRVGDPGREVYRAAGLERGTLSQLFGPRVWWRGFKAGILDRHLVGWLKGDGFQMPGLVLLRDGRVVWSYRHRSAADRPDYVAACEAGIAS